MSLLHMMATILSYCRIDEPQLLKEAMRNIASLHLMPKPLGEQALRVLMMIQTEQLTNGFSLINRYIEETRCPRIIVEDEQVQPLFYIVNQQQQVHLTWACIIGINKLDENPNWSIKISESAMAVFILGVLKHVGSE